MPLYLAFTWVPRLQNQVLFMQRRQLTFAISSVPISITFKTLTPNRSTYALRIRVINMKSPMWFLQGCHWGSVLLGSLFWKGWEGEDTWDRRTESIRVNAARGYCGYRQLWNKFPRCFYLLRFCEETERDPAPSSSGKSEDYKLIKWKTLQQAACRCSVSTGPCLSSHSLPPWVLLHFQTT